MKTENITEAGPAVLAGVENDIPLDVANKAHEGTSMSPERRGYLHRDSYAEQMRSDYGDLVKAAESPELITTVLDPAFARFREKYKGLYLDYLHARSRVRSILVEGPANFPGRQNQKRGEWADNAYQKCRDYRARFLKRLRLDLRPSQKPIMAGDDDAVKRLRGKIAAAEQAQDQMRRMNRAWREAGRPKHDDDEGWRKVADIYGISDNDLRELRRKMARMDWIDSPFASYELTNNNANIRRMKGRLARIESAKATPTQEEEGPAARVVLDPAANRVRLFFPGKPSAEIRGRLKSGGFRWARSIGAWQAYPHPHTVELARKVAGIIKEEGEPA